MQSNRKPVHKPWEHLSPLKPSDARHSANSNQRSTAQHDTDSSDSEHQPEPGDIRIEYIPCAKRADVHTTAEEYNGPPKHIPYKKVKEALKGRAAWFPFKSRADFEVARIALEALNHWQLDALLSTLQWCLQGEDTLSFTPPRSHELADIKSDSAPQALRLNVGPARAQLPQAQLYLGQLSFLQLSFEKKLSNSNLCLTELSYSQCSSAL
ncbi:hypothetical protein NMY22_g13380 [Coprinellus aureogranulatus]|nr:hypothetical protein NMY22_g13380 [Coprinellus aureogranulatus]